MEEVGRIEKWAERDEEHEEEGQGLEMEEDKKRRGR